MNETEILEAYQKLVILYSSGKIVNDEVDPIERMIYNNLEGKFIQLPNGNMLTSVLWHDSMDYCAVRELVPYSKVTPNG